ncbi:MBL fold metallo-hydrolase [Yeosuana sp. MJ-SS3]|uniref:MBL fold metallo-hydrolase n=1 Tax=Gilvirhabdus luticola TaxID=3079858 RepID=A0ABU3U978_9FLAO|nr:MBL fold metallo-hydrolase [Yeosuana sp. MJ-SS3]MDU8886635.1 MBL fold metallo-hydrolase [Yeosuana sp. MJ-SS3]
MKTLNFISSFIFTFFFLSTFGQDVNIEVQKLSDKLYMLIGQGGNIGVSAGDDGIIIIDDQFAPLTPKIIAALKTISDKPVKYVVNTHHHGDHTGGNENLSKLGATIIAHDNVRKHLEDQPKEALPVLTFNDKMSVYINGEQVLVFHLDNAHTDGDSMLYFTKSNILHTGDIYFKDRYPYIDLNSGGSVNGYIEAIKQVLIIIDDDTKIIPGHGSVSNKKEYQDFLIMLATLKTHVEKEIEAGKTEDEVANNKDITKAYDDIGFGSGYINSEKIRRTFFKSLKN